MSELLPRTLRELRKGISIRTGISCRFRIRDPEVDTPTCSIPASVFAAESSFPGPGIFSFLRSVAKTLDTDPAARIAIFGHDSAGGGGEAEKERTERRAMMVRALLVHDLDAFARMAEEEQWDLRFYQAMLRGIGCNPGAIDGSEGDFTHESLRRFQGEYNEGIYKDTAIPLERMDLPMDGRLGDETRVALRYAYLSASPVRVSEERFARVGFAGCGASNPVSGKDKENRRIVVARFRGSLPADDEFPCREGNAHACDLDGRGEMKCRFYRRYVHEQPETGYPRFSDLEWRKEESEKVFLTALTCLPDETPVRFRIARTEEEIPDPPADSVNGGQRPAGEELASITGKTACGVCYARWTPPEDFDPFNFDDWWDTNDEQQGSDGEGDEDFFIDSYSHDSELKWYCDEEYGEDPETMGQPSGSSEEEPPPSRESGGGREEEDRGSILHLPVFIVEAENHWACSAPPGKRIDLIRLPEHTESVQVITSRARLRTFRVRNGKVQDKIEILNIISVGSVASEEE